MKKIMRNTKTRTFVVSLLLIAGVFASAVTIAFYTDTTQVLANTFTTTEITTHINEVVSGTGSLINKNPSIYNDGPASGFIRARITVSPDLITNTGDNNYIELITGTGKLKFTAGEVTEAGWLFGGDGYYYYNKVVAAGTSTTTLFDQVIIGTKVKENFDITIYQEAVTSKHYEGEANQDNTYNLATLQNAFNSVNQ